MTHNDALTWFFGCLRRLLRCDPEFDRLSRQVNTLTEQLSQTEAARAALEQQNGALAAELEAIKKERQQAIQSFSLLRSEVVNLLRLSEDKRSWAHRATAARDLVRVLTLMLEITEEEIAPINGKTTKGMEDHFRRFIGFLNRIRDFATTSRAPKTLST